MGEQSQKEKLLRIMELEMVIKDRGHAFQAAQNKSLIKIAELRELIKKKDEALVEAIDLITSEYCSHISKSGNCGTGVEGCYASEIYKALSLKEESEESK